MRSTKAFVIGVGTALFVDRALLRRRRRRRARALDDDAIVHRIHADVLPATGVSPEDVDVEVHDGVVELSGAVEGSERADALIGQVASVPGVKDVAAMLRVSERHAA